MMFSLGLGFLLSRAWQVFRVNFHDLWGKHFSHKLLKKKMAWYSRSLILLHNRFEINSPEHNVWGNTSLNDSKPP